MPFMQFRAVVTLALMTSNVLKLPDECSATRVSEKAVFLLNSAVGSIMLAVSPPVLGAEPLNAVTHAVLCNFCLAIFREVLAASCTVVGVSHQPDGCTLIGLRRYDKCDMYRPGEPGPKQCPHH